MNITELNLSIRDINAISRAGCTTVEELKQKISDDLDGMKRQLGFATFDRIEDALSEFEPENVPDVIHENPDAHARAYYLLNDTKSRISVIEENYYAVCKNIKEMRDGKLYKELGYQNFEDCCKTEFGLAKRQCYKYIGIVENLPEDFVQSTAQIGTEKLSLLAMLDEPTREAVTESVDVESATVKELKAHIAELTNDKNKLESETADIGQKLDAAQETINAKSKQFKEAMESKDRQFQNIHKQWVDSQNEVAKLTSKNVELEEQLKAMENRPVEVAVSEDEAKEIERLKEELENTKLRLVQAQKSVDAKAQKMVDEMRHQMTQVHEEELQTLKDGYEKQLACESRKPDNSALDRAKFYTLKTIFENVVDELENMLDDLHDDPRIRYINELDNYWTDNLLYLKREGEGAGK